MNFGRIFLAKCLLLLFPKAKCTSTINYKAVNETALLSFAAENTHEILWSRDNKRLLEMKDKKIKYYVEKTQCRCKVLLNGTLRIERLVKEDSGIYKVSAYDKNGKLKANETIVLIVLEPVPQPILNAECINKTLYVKCTVKKTEDQVFTIELTQDKISKSQTNVTEVEFTTRHSGRYRCIVKNQVSKKTTEKEIKCPGQLELYLISCIAGGAVFFIVFVILLIYCIRKKKADRLEDDDEERMQIHQVDTEMAMRKLPQPPSNPIPQQTCVQQTPPPQPCIQQRAVPPQPRPRTQLRERH
ncbi:T-cell surface antigen CD2 [Centrocercus urophasianus]|uniref:T-cell surface antigen CD2 n=1 Tax=Centrocercus urophasianus TaxID=9002 RepID=UPI001C64EFBD|nr:T-cell surface antigen CD2 [Centrocercus urophasianus]